MQELRSIDTRSTVLGRVKNPEDSESWQVFFQTYAPLVRNQAIRAGLSEHEADDVAQETMIEVARRIQTFEYDRRKGSFKGWLFRLTSWRVANHLQRRRQSPLSLEVFSADPDNSNVCTAEIVVNTGLDEAWEQEWRHMLFEAALNNLRRELPPKHFQVLDCLVIKEWNVADAAGLLRINRAHLYVLKCRVVLALKNEIRRLERCEVERCVQTSGPPSWDLVTGKRPDMVRARTL